MPRLLRPPQVRVVPKDGEITISLDINITIDGNVVTVNETVKKSVTEDDDAPPPMFIPDLSSGVKVDFGK